MVKVRWMTRFKQGLFHFQEAQQRFDVVVIGVVERDIDFVILLPEVPQYGQMSVVAGRRGRRSKVENETLELWLYSRASVILFTGNEGDDKRLA